MGAAEPLILGAWRTPLGRPGGQLAGAAAPQLAAAALRAAAAPVQQQAGLTISEVVLGNTIGPGGNVARFAALAAGLPVTVPALTIDRQCGSGLDAVRLAAERIGPGAVALGGGAESVSTSPMLQRRPNGALHVARAPMAPAEMGDPDMAEAAEMVARRYGISRREQDEWACRSVALARQAAAAGRLMDGLIPIADLGAKEDEWRDRPFAVDRLARHPALTGPGGTVTAANSAPPADGAAVLLIGTAAAADRMALPPLARIVAYAAAGVQPDEPGMGPVPALQAACRQAGVQPGRLDRVEINEAYAAKVLACVRALELDPDLVNPDGGAIALGHPFGATGAFMLVRLVHALRPGQFGAVTLGIGGGLGVAMIVEGLERSP